MGTLTGDGDIGVIFGSDKIRAQPSRGEAGRHRPQPYDMIGLQAHRSK